MTEYCRRRLSEGRYTFPCPDASCTQTWEFFLVCHVTHFPAEERIKHEKKLAENYLNKAAGIQKCPGCFNYCRRKDGKNNCVVWPICTKSNGNNIMFCWACLGEWKEAGAVKCGNDQCDGLDGRIRVLAKCGTKQMLETNQECPMIRCCPKCGTLIEHKQYCKHMDCPTCKHSFCFVCMLGKNPDGKTWTCGENYGVCTLAPRQTVLPGSE